MKTAVAGVHKVVITPSKNVAATAVVTLTKDKAYTIASDGTVTNFASTLPGKNANIVFPATAGTTYTLKLSGSTFPGSNPVVVKDTSLKAVASVTFGNMSSNSTILVTFTAAKTGNYTITLSPAGDAIGSVDFKVVVGSTAANDRFYNKQVIAMADKRPPFGQLVRPFSSLVPSTATAI